MYGYNRYTPGNVEGTTRFWNDQGGNLQLGFGKLSSRIKAAIDAKRNAPQLGAAAGASAGRSAAMASPTARQNIQHARSAQLPRPLGPDGTPDYGLGDPGTNPTQIQAASPQASAQYAAAQVAAGQGRPMPGQSPMPGAGPGAPPTAPRHAMNPGAQAAQQQVGQAPLGVDPQDLLSALNSGSRPGTPGQAPMVDPGAMVDTLNTPINPANYMAQSLGGKNVLLRNGADPRNPRPGDLKVFENGQWVDAGADVGSDLYNQMHIEEGTSLGNTSNGQTSQGEGTTGGIIEKYK